MKTNLRIVGIGLRQLLGFGGDEGVGFFLQLALQRVHGGFGFTRGQIGA